MCHAGIATQVETCQEAEAVGIRGFQPLDLEESIGRLERLFTGLGREIARLSNSDRATEARNAAAAPYSSGRP